MKTLSVGEFKSHFSDVLDEVKAGESIGIVYGRSKTPVAMLVPFDESRFSERPLGLLEGRASVTFHDDWEIAPETLFQNPS